MIVLFKPYTAARALDMISSVLARGYIGEGPMVKRFEQELVRWIGECAVVNSGTSALWLAADLLHLNEDTLVVMTPMTCLATGIPFAHRRCPILWADCDPVTGLIDIEDVRALFMEYGSRIKAVVAVDYGGQLAVTPELLTLAANNGAWVIEDAAHSFGLQSRPSVSNLVVCYSFQAIKMLTTGDGGAIACANGKMLEEARLKRWFGLDRSQGGFRCEQTVRFIGYKMHMNDIAAALGLANLPHVATNLYLHLEHAIAYLNAGIGIDSERGSTHWLHTIHVPDRESFIEKMADRSVQCARVHTRIDRQPIFMAEEHRALPGVTEFDRTQVSIPVGWHLTADDIAHVIRSVKEVLA